MKRIRLLEKAETKLDKLRRMLNQGEQSGICDYHYDTFIADLDNANPDYAPAAKPSYTPA